MCKISRVLDNLRSQNLCSLCKIWLLWTLLFNLLSRRWLSEYFLSCVRCVVLSRTFEFHAIIIAPSLIHSTWIPSLRPMCEPHVYFSLVECGIVVYLLSAILPDCYSLWWVVSIWCKKSTTNIADVHGGQ